VSDNVHEPVGGEDAVLQDGFRPRRKRAKGEIDKLIKAGIVRGPDDPADRPGEAFDGEKWVKLGDDAMIIGAPVATLRGE
jgi:hypothetical protein